VNQHLPFSITFFILLLLSSCQVAKLTVDDYVKGPGTQFAIEKIYEALDQKELSNSLQITIRLQKATDSLAEEGYHLEIDGDQIEVIGGGAAGAMYGALELAEQLRLFGPKGVKPTKSEPYMERRGVKFNIPLDARTPSYTDASDAGQKNIDVMWDMNFWTEYLDELALHRYNYVSLWSLHPFPSLVKVPQYEELALDNVHRSSAQWEEYYHLHGTGLDSPELLDKPEILKKITIEEKIEFWRKVMRYGKERNIDFYLITWNIFTNGSGGKYGITDAIDNEITKDYFRKSVTQCFISYPDLAGIGLTTGENMHRQTFDLKEQWAYDTYANGVLDAAKLMPERKFTFIHRQHQTGAKDIAKKFKTVIDHPNIDFLFCFKYAKAHAMSATKQHYHQGFVKDIKGMKTIWGLRNDSNYHFRWGAPDYVREFIGNLPRDVAAGIYYGSDQWVQGRDFLSKNSDLSMQLEIKKNWFHWLLWGRLSYDHKLDNERLTAIVGARFPEANASTLINAWQEASMILPSITGFHWGPVDFKWYPEACKSRPGPANNETGFHDVDRFITLEVHPMAGFQSIPDFISHGPQDSLLTPEEVALKIANHAETAEELISNSKTFADPELEATITDIKTMSLLGHYYAKKIRGSYFLARYRKTRDETDLKESISYLEDALQYWKHYVQLADSQYKNPLWTNRVGHVDWAELTTYVAADIEIAKQAKISAK